MARTRRHCAPSSSSSGSTLLPTLLPVLLHTSVVLCRLFYYARFTAALLYLLHTEALDGAEALLELPHLVGCVALLSLLGCKLALQLALDLLVLVAARLSRVASKHSNVGSKVLSDGLDLLVLVAARLRCERMSA
jgi:hypothetical protein